MIYYEKLMLSQLLERELSISISFNIYLKNNIGTALCHVFLCRLQFVIHIFFLLFFRISIDVAPN